MRKIFAIILLSGVVFVLTKCGSKKANEHEEMGHDMKMEATDEKLGADIEIKDGQYVFFTNIEDGNEIISPFTVEMGVFGMEVEPAGELALNKGHHHILINKEYVPRLDVIQNDSTHLHFGLGQTSTELILEPGDYMISLQFADGFHRSYGQKMSSSIQITVIE